MLTENNVHIRSHRESTFTYTFDEHYFDSIDTKDKAYWLGFIYADGFIVKNHKHKRGHDILGITLAEKEPLEKFNKCVKCNKPIYTFTQDGYKKDSVKYRLTFPSDHLVKQLEKWGCVERKTFCLEFPKFINDDLIPHFVRGYFDGDGSVFNKNNGQLGVTICGTESFLKDLEAKIGLFKNKVYRDHRKETDCWSIKIASMPYCLQLYHYFYKNSGDLFLSRKREKFENFIKERTSTTTISNLTKTYDYGPYCYLED